MGDESAPALFPPLAPRPSRQDSNCECVVCSVLKYGFFTRTLAEKKQLILRGRPTPELPDLTQTKTRFLRHFHSNNYERHAWLTGCPIKNALFCWPCLLFSKDASPWNKQGFTDLSNLAKLVQRHSSSKSHVVSVFGEKTFGKTQRGEFSISETVRILNTHHNERVKENREILKRFIDVTCYLAEHQLEFRGHDESEDSPSRGNCKDLVSLLAKYDETLRNHLDNSAVFQCTSAAIQNDLIASIGTVVLNRIKEDVQEASFVAIIVDETVDAENISLLSTVIRYVTKLGDICERFLGFRDVAASRDAASLSKLVDDTMNSFNCGDRLVAQSYDGASVLSAEIGGLQTKVRKSYVSALFVHCMGHRLDLVLQDAAKQITQVKGFFVSLNGFLDFFSRSSQRCRALDSEVKKISPRPVQVSWNSNSQLFHTIHDYREPLITFFENVTENEEEWDSDTINLAYGFLHKLKDFNFNFLLLLFVEIFGPSDLLFEMLQKKSNDIDFCVKQIEEFCEIVASKRNAFDSFWERTQTLESVAEPTQKRIRIGNVGDIKASYASLFNQIIDLILEQMNERFGNFAELKFLELLNFADSKEINESAFEALQKNYGSFFDFPALRTGLSVVYEWPVGLDKKGASSMWHSLKSCGLDLDKAGAEVLKLCELAQTIAPTGASAESFSALTRISAYTRSSSGQDRTSHLSLLSVEKTLVQEMRWKSSFYDDVISEFAKKEIRIPLLFK